MDSRAVFSGVRRAYRVGRGLYDIGRYSYRGARYVGRKVKKFFKKPARFNYLRIRRV